MSATHVFYVLCVSSEAVSLLWSIQSVQYATCACGRPRRMRHFNANVRVCACVYTRFNVCSFCVDVLSTASVTQRLLQRNIQYRKHWKKSMTYVRAMCPPWPHNVSHAHARDVHRTWKVRTREGRPLDVFSKFLGYSYPCIGYPPKDILLRSLCLPRGPTPIFLFRYM